MRPILAKLKIECETCGCTLHRRKTFKTSKDTIEEAKAEIEHLTREWKKKLRGTNCAVCQSIIDTTPTPTPKV